jgi:hypothetical protein
MMGTTGEPVVAGGPLGWISRTLGIHEQEDFFLSSLQDGGRFQGDGGIDASNLQFFDFATF